MNGIIIIDKPAGWTSHDVVAKLRGILKIKRIGHGGTLDPMATGVLPIFIGRATRASEFCENADKEYIAGLRLGLVTDTQDICGNTLSVCEPSVSIKKLTEIISHFIGAQKQTPPMYSAVKIGGKKLYELARRGVEVERPERDIFISCIDLLESEENDFLLRIACSKGTYIRTLCHDIGATLGCGGTMSSLRRIKAGVFTIDKAHTLDEIIDAAQSEKIASLALPIDTVLSEYQSVTLSDEHARKCKNGALHKITGLQDGTYRFYGPDNEFLVLGELRSGNFRILKSFVTT